MATKLFKEEQDYIINNYPIFGPLAVSKQLGRSMGAVRKFAKDNGLQLKDRKERIGLNILKSFHAILKILDIFLKSKINLLPLYQLHKKTFVVFFLLFFYMKF